MLPAASPLDSPEKSINDSGPSEKPLRERIYARLENFDRIAKSLLHEPLQIASHRGAHRLSITLGQLTAGLAINPFLIKGSRAWTQADQTVTASSDLDLQVSAPADSFQEHGKHLIERISQWANTQYATQPHLSHRGHSASPSWINRSLFWQSQQGPSLLVSLGKKLDRCRVIDLVFHCDALPVNFDSLNASRVIEIDTRARTAVTKDVVHPALLKWLRTHQVHWFDRDIEQGLLRLSYRASKQSPLTVLQADLWDHFLERSSQEQLSQMVHLSWVDLSKHCCPSLRNNTGHPLEKPHWNLPVPQRSAHWSLFLDMIASLQAKVGPMLGQLKTGTPDQLSRRQSDAILLHTIVLDWTQHASLDSLMALNAQGQSADADEALTRWLNACRCSSDLKQILPAFLSEWAGLRDAVARQGPALLNIRLLDAEQLARMLKNSHELDVVPSQELQRVLGEGLQHMIGLDHSDQAPSLAQQTLDWIERKPLGSLAILLHRIPPTRRSSPRASECTAITELLKQLLKSPQSLAVLDSALGLIRLPKHHLDELVQTVRSEYPNCDKALGILQDQPTWLQAINVLNTWQHQLTELTQSEDSKGRTILCVAHSQAIAKKLRDLAVPQLIAEMVQIKADRIEIRQPGSSLFKLNIMSTGVQAVAAHHVFDFNTQGGWIHSQQQASLTLVKHVFWPDMGLLAMNGPPSENHCTGTLKIPVKHMMQSHKGLMRQGADLLEALGTSVTLDQSHVQAKGDFLSSNIQLSSGYASALEGLQSGKVSLFDPNGRPLAQWVFIDGKPVKLTIQRPDCMEPWLFNIDLVDMPDCTPTVRSAWLNAWRTWPAAPLHLTAGFLKAHDRGIHCEIELTITMEIDTLRLVEECTLTGKQLGKHYAWAGPLNTPQLIPDEVLPFAVTQNAAGDLPSIRTISGPIPIAAIPHYLLLCQLANVDQLNCGTTMHVISQPVQSWPSCGFFELTSPTGAFYMTGHTWPDGRIWGSQQLTLQVADRLHQTYSAGQFMRLPGEAIRLIKTITDPRLHHAADLPMLNLTGQGAIRPHGLCSNQDPFVLATVPLADTESTLFFCGLGFPISRSAPPLTQLYQPINSLEYWYMRCPANPDWVYHLLFKQPDGVADSMIRLPSQPSKAYVQEMWDSKGLHVSLVIQRGGQALAQIDLPNGLSYRGQFVDRDGLFVPCGRGLFTNGQHQVSVTCRADGTVSALSSKQEHSQSMLADFQSRHGMINTVDDLIRAIHATPMAWLALAREYLQYDHVVGRNLDRYKDKARVCEYRPEPLPLTYRRV